MPRLGSLALIAVLLCSPARAAEQSYKVYFGGQQLGWVLYSSGTTSTLSSLLDGTPFGVFDGRYEGQSRQTGQGGARYEGRSTATRKNRDVEIVRNDAGQVIEVTISPEKDRTESSNPAEVPEDVLDPVAGFGRLVSGTSCPVGFKLYDGRRVVQVSPRKTTSNGTALTCWMDYSVIHGPGHLSPLYIKSIDLRMEFDPAILEAGPNLLSFRSGLLELQFRRD